MNYKTIILDFDGTIVDSVGVKDRAFQALYADYPQHLDTIMDYHLAHNATVRWDKFEYIARNILNVAYTPTMQQQLGQRFAQLVFEQIVDCPYVAGALEFLDFFYGKIPLYLVSASPETELDMILDCRQLKRYFKRVYAIPWIKAEAFKEIMTTEKVSPAQTVFIGDTIEDYYSACSAGINFIGRDSGKVLPDGCLKYSDLKEVMQGFKEVV